MSPEEARMKAVESALIALLGRVKALEAYQREAIEQIQVRLGNFPKRLDHVEREIIALRKLPRGRRVKT